jgi:hypothetical protein
MFPRQRLYETYDLIDSYGYEQIGGAKFDTLGDLFAASGKAIKKAGQSILNFPISSIAKLTGETRDKVLIYVSKSLDNPQVSNLFGKTFAPNIIKRFPAIIVDKLPLETLKKLDLNTLANKVSLQRLQEIRRFPDEVKFADSIIDVKKLNKDNEEMFELIRLQEEAKASKWDEINFDAVDEANVIDPKLRNPLLDDPPSTIAKTPSSGTTSAVETVVKKADEIEPTPTQVKAIKDTVEPSDVSDLAKTNTKETTDVARVKQASWVSRNKGKTFVIGAVSVGAIAYGGYALDNFIKKNDAPFKIIKMELDTKDPKNSIWFFYEVTPDTQFELTTNNWILLEENNATPKIPINKIYKIVEVDNEKRRLRIFLQENELPTSLGNSGKFRYQTTFGVQLEESAKDVAEALGSSAGAAASGAAKGILGGVLETLGISTTNFLIGTGVTIGIIIILIIIYMVMNRGSK